MIQHEDLSLVKKCKDYEILKENLSEKELMKIDSVLAHYYNLCYEKNGIHDIYEEYIYEYGNCNIIEWYEGMKTTKSFLRDFKVEGVDEYEIM